MYEYIYIYIYSRDGGLAPLSRFLRHKAIDFRSGFDDLRNSNSSTGYRGVAFSKSREHEFESSTVGHKTRKNRCFVRFPVRVVARFGGANCFG